MRKEHSFLKLEELDYQLPATVVLQKYARGVFFMLTFKTRETLQAAWLEKGF